MSLGSYWRSAILCVALVPGVVVIGALIPASEGTQIITILFGLLALYSALISATTRRYRSIGLPPQVVLLALVPFFAPIVVLPALMLPPDYAARLSWNHTKRRGDSTLPLNSPAPSTADESAPIRTTPGPSCKVDCIGGAPSMAVSVSVSNSASARPEAHISDTSELCAGSSRAPLTEGADTTNEQPLATPALGAVIKFADVTIGPDHIELPNYSGPPNGLVIRLSTADGTPYDPADCSHVEPSSVVAQISGLGFNHSVLVDDRSLILKLASYYSPIT